jgi:hypothetical protein
MIFLATFAVKAFLHGAKKKPVTAEYAKKSRKERKGDSDSRRPPKVFSQFS